MRTGSGFLAAADAGRKVHFRGTHRTRSPCETVRTVQPLLPVMGITRVGNITGLDNLGVPVVMVARLNSRSLSVAQGKGLTLDAAKASGVMEAVEGYHAENVQTPLRYGSHEDVRYTERVVDPAQLPPMAGSLYTPHFRLLWARAWDLNSDVPLWVPFELVHTDYTLPLPAGSGCFLPSSNGLASGNTIVEAVVHGVCEVVERDATSTWLHRSQEAQAQTRIDLSTVRDRDCRAILDRCESAGVVVGVWETTSDLGIPAFLATMVDRGSRFRQLYSASGMGCHRSPTIALLRAVTEAAQSRLTLIAGSRDDTFPAEYRSSLTATVREAQAQRIVEEPPRRPFSPAGDEASDTLARDLEWLVAQLGRRGFHQVLVVDLAKPEFSAFAYSVVRVLIPGLEGSHEVPGYVPGPRAKAMGHEPRRDDHHPSTTDPGRRGGAS